MESGTRESESQSGRCRKLNLKLNVKVVYLDCSLNWGWGRGGLKDGSLDLMEGDDEVPEPGGREVRPNLTSLVGKKFRQMAFHSTFVSQLRKYLLEIDMD